MDDDFELKNLSEAQLDSLCHAISRCKLINRMIKLKMEILSGYFGKVCPRSSLLKNYFVSCDASVTDSDFHGTVLILMTNNSKDPILIKAGKELRKLFFTKRKKLGLKKLIV